MEITLKLEVSERLHTLAERFAALAERYLDVTWPPAEPAEESVCTGETHVKSAEIPLDDAESPEAVNPPTDDGNDAQAQTSCAADPDPLGIVGEEVAPEASESERPKSRRGRPRKAAKAEPTETAEIAPQAPEPVEAINPPTDDGNDAQTQTSCAPEPVSAPAAQSADAVPDATEADAQADPYNGMTLLGAVQSLLDEVRDKGLELADVNARVRKECSARSLPFSSAACLMKAVGYVQARRIVLGE